LALRFAAGSPLNKKAEAVSNFVFWVGASFLISNFLLDTRWVAVWHDELIIWFVFWSMIIMILGFSLIVRAIVLAAAPKRHLI
jgi:hypothetical protein